MSRQLLLCVALASASPWYESGAVELSPLAKENAIFYLHALEKHMDRRMEESALRTLIDKQAEVFEGIEKDKPEMWVAAVREWVKNVGPFLGEPEDKVDRPLHTVLERAEEILDMERIEDQDVHPHHAAKAILSIIKQWTKALLTVYRERARKELDEGGGKEEL